MSLDIILIALYPNATRILQPADVSAFKPIKNGWKKAVLVYQRNNPNKGITKENFASILQTVIDKSLSAETIQNGFRSCGLYPWNKDAIDFTKCLGKNLYLPVSPTTPTSMSQEDFKKLVGDKMYNECVSHYINSDNKILTPECNLAYKLYMFFIGHAYDNNLISNTSQLDITTNDAYNHPITDVKTTKIVCENMNKTPDIPKVVAIGTEKPS